MTLIIPPRTQTKSTGLIIPQRTKPALPTPITTKPITPELKKTLDKSMRKFMRGVEAEQIQNEMIKSGQAKLATEPIVIPPRDDKPKGFVSGFKEGFFKPFKTIANLILPSKKSKETEQERQIRRQKEIAEFKQPIPIDYREPKMAGQLNEALKESTTRAISAFGSSVEALGVKWDNERIRKAGEKFADDFKKVSAQHPEWQAPTDMKKWSDPDFYARLAGGIIPSIAGAFGIGAVTTIATGGNIPAGVVVGFAYSKALEGGFAYQEALKSGATEKQAQDTAQFVGNINGVLEIIPIGRMLNKIPAGKQIKKNLFSRLSREFFKQGGFEAGTEGIQEFVNNAFQQEFDENRGLFDGVLESMAGGFMAGGFLGPTVEFVVSPEAKEIAKEFKKIPIGLTIEDVSKKPKLKIKPIKLPEPITKAIPDEFQARVIAGQDLGKEIGKKVNPDGTLTLYHGTSKQNATKILQSGKFNKGVYFSVEKTGTQYGDSPLDVAKRKFGKDATIMEIKVDARNLESAAAGSEVFSPKSLFKEDGIWKTIKVVKEVKPIEITEIKPKLKKITPKKVKEFIGEKPAPFIRKRETTLLKERIKEIQKSALSEVNKKAKIQRLENEFKIRLEKAVRKEQLKTLKVGITERIKGIAKGVRESRVLTKNEITATQTEIIGILDKSKLERSDKAKFIRAIKNVQTTEQLKKALPEIQARIEKLSEEAESRTIIKDIQKVIKATIVKGKKPKGKYTPEIQNVLNSIKKLTDLNQKNANAKLENNLKEYAIKMPVEVAMENKLLSLYTGTSAQKQELLNIIKRLMEKGEITSALKKFNIQADIQRKSNLVIDRVTGGKGIEQGRLLGELTDKTKIQKVKQFLKAVGKKTILDWRGLMTTLDFNSSVKEKSLADFFSVSKNESKYKELQSKYREEFDIAISDIYGIKNKPNSILKVVNKIATDKIKVDKYEMTRDELIKRYMEIQDPTLIDSFKQGNKYTDKTLQAIENKITEQDKKFAKWQLEYYKEIYSNVNKIYSTMNGVDLPFNEFYSPIRRVGYKVEPGHTEFTDEAFYRKAVTDKSLISRVKNLNPILKQGSLSVLDRHITDINYYIAWAEKIRELDSVFTNNEVREAIKQEFPSNILETIINKIQHIATHGNKTASRIGWVDGLRKSYVVGNLAVKPALTVKQLVSTLAYAERIKAHELAIGILDFAKNPVKNFNILKNESAFIKMRGLGMERDIREAIKEGVFSRYNKRQNLANTLLLNIKLGDKGAIVLGSWAMRRARLKAGVSLQDVIHEYEEFSADTQQSADISRLSEIQLGGSMEKLFTVFKSTQRAYFQKELNVIKSMFRKDGFGKENIRKVARTLFIYHLLLPVIFQWVANMGGWDEDDIKDYKRAAILGSFNGLFIAGDIIDSIIRQIMGMRVWDIEVLPVDIGDDINKIISNLTEEDVDTEDIQTALDALASASTGVTGLPLEYSYDILESLYNENYETGMKQILGWSEYVIGKPKKKKKIKGRKSLEEIFDIDKTKTKRKSLEEIFELN